MVHSTFDRWLLGATGLITVLVIAGVVTFQNTQRLYDDAQMVAHTHEVREAIATVTGRLREAEAVQRTYLILGGDADPPAFGANVAAASVAVDQLKQLTDDNTDQQARLPEIQERIDALYAFWGRTMAVRREQGFEAARQIVAEGESRRMIAELQERLQAMDNAEGRLLGNRLERRERTYRSALGGGLLASIAAVLFVAAFIVLLRRHLSSQIAAAAVIAEQGERLRTTLASIGDAVMTTDNTGRITTINAVAESLTEWKGKEAVGRRLEEVFRIVNETTREPVENPAARALQEGAIVGLANHTVLIGKQGGERAIDDSAAPIRCKDGEIVGCVLVFRDVTERRMLERKVIERLAEARRLAAIVETSDDAIISKTLDGVIQTWNVAAERLFGYTAQQAVGRHISLVIPPDRIQEEDQIVASLKSGNCIDHFETVRRRSDGREIIVSLTISPLKDEEGRIVGASKIVRDITEMRQTERERQRLVTLIENSTDFVGVCDMVGVPTYVNRAGLELVGLESLEQARRTPVRDFFFPEDQPRIVNEFFPSILEKGHGEIEIRFRNFKTGEARWMAYKVLTLLDDEGYPSGFATVSQDMTERRRLEDGLRKSAADLSEADRRKDEFLATLAHELRNPLAPIRNALQILRLSPDGPTAEQARTVMQRQLEQMVRLVDDLMDVSRITRGKLELRRGPVSLAAVIGSAVETSRPMIDHLGHELTVTLPERPIMVDADLTRLAQVFSNLLNNSAKYMDRGGRIWLTAERKGADVVVSVKDAGIGIAADQLPHIFQMFSQVDGSLTRSQGGLGIGLTLVSRLVEMHGGSIEAKSEGLGKGAEFVVRLPIVADTPHLQSVNGEDDHAPQTSLRILIVDDNRDSADSLMMLLKMMGNETRTAYDGEEGVRTAEEFHPDVVLLDIGLPKLSGYEACRLIRPQPWAANSVLIAVTGWGQDDDRRQSREAGFDHHLVKPVNPQELMKLLAEFGKVSP